MTHMKQYLQIHSAWFININLYFTLKKILLHFNGHLLTQILFIQFLLKIKANSSRFKEKLIVSYHRNNREDP